MSLRDLKFVLEFKEHDTEDKEITFYLQIKGKMAVQVLHTNWVLKHTSDKHS